MSSIPTTSARPRRTALGLALLVHLLTFAFASPALAAYNLGFLGLGSWGTFSWGWSITPPEEVEPDPPFVNVRWKTPDAVKVQWIDDSDSETGFALQQRRPGEGWQHVRSLDALAGDYLTASHVVRGLASGTDYCFRVVARNSAGDSRAVDYNESCTRTTTAGACGENILESLLEPAHAGSRGVEIDCDLTLEPTQTVTKQLLLLGKAASGVTVDLNGALLQGGPGTFNEGRDTVVIASERHAESRDPYCETSWDRPQGVTVRNGRIEGAIRVIGMAKNGQGQPDYEYRVDECTTDPATGEERCTHEAVEIPGTNWLKNSSRTANHTECARKAAPTDVTLEALAIGAHGRVPLYLAPGVTHTTLLDSSIRGRSAGPAIYLDAESAFNTIRNSVIDVDTKGTITTTWDRPAIAIDGSSDNLIVDNHFSDLKNGGIFLYRNCGEGGVIRHNTPSHNEIVNNVFFYAGYDGGNPAVFIGSRDRSDLEEEINPFGFCFDDSGYEFGSSASQRDHARNNAVLQNQIYVRPLDEAIRVQNEAVNSGNTIAYNETVTSASVDHDRPAGCYLPINGSFLEDGEVLEGETVGCLRTDYACDDGDLFVEEIDACTVTTTTPSTTTSYESGASEPTGGTVWTTTASYGFVAY